MSDEYKYPILDSVGICTCSGESMVTVKKIDCEAVFRVTCSLCPWDSDYYDGTPPCAIRTVKVIEHATNPLSGWVRYPNYDDRLHFAVANTVV